MKVKTLVDIDIVPAGSILENVREVDIYYEGIWHGPGESLSVRAKKEHCEIIVE